MLNQMYMKKCRRQPIVKWQKSTFKQILYIVKVGEQLNSQIRFFSTSGFACLSAKMLWHTKSLTPSSGKKNSTVAKTTIDGANR